MASTLDYLFHFIEIKTESWQNQSIQTQGHIQVAGSHPNEEPLTPDLVSVPCKCEFDTHTVDKASNKTSMSKHRSNYTTAKNNNNKRKENPKILRSYHNKNAVRSQVWEIGHY